MRNLALSSLLLFLLFAAGCSSKLTKGLRKTEVAMVSKTELYPLFHQTDGSLLFNMQIDFRKNHFSGLLLVKSTGRDRYRTAFMSHFGMSIFDFELSADSFAVNHCVDVLNRKQILRVLENDFRGLFLLNIGEEDNKASVYKDKNNSASEVVKIGRYYYLKDNQQRRLQEIDAPHPISTLHYDFLDYTDDFPTMIRISHSRIGLTLQLERLKR